MQFDVVASPAFAHHIRDLPDVARQQVKRKIQLLTQNPYHPSLRTKPIRRLGGYFEFSVNMDVRVIWRYNDLNTIYLADVGHHDILRRF